MCLWSYRVIDSINCFVLQFCYKTAFPLNDISAICKKAAWVELGTEQTALLILLQRTQGPAVTLPSSQLGPGNLWWADKEQQLTWAPRRRGGGRCGTISQVPIHQPLGACKCSTHLGLTLRSRREVEKSTLTWSSIIRVGLTASTFHVQQKQRAHFLSFLFQFQNPVQQCQAS